MTGADRAAEDAAAVVVVLALLADRPAEVSGLTGPSTWSDPAHRLRLAPAPSATAWWVSGLPR
jgi:hypothetical protein